MDEPSKGTASDNRSEMRILLVLFSSKNSARENAAFSQEDLLRICAYNGSIPMDRNQQVPLEILQYEHHYRNHILRKMSNSSGGKFVAFYTISCSWTRTTSRIGLDAAKDPAFNTEFVTNLRPD